MDTRPHILHVIWSLGLGGAEQMVISLLSGLDQKRYRVSVCCLHDEGPFADQLKQCGVSVFAMRKRPKLDVGLVSRLAGLMRDERVSLVQTHLWSANFWGRWAAARAKVPVVIATEHGIERWRGALHRLADRWLAARTRKVVFVSDTVRERELAAHAWLRGRSMTIPNGVSPQAFPRVDQDLRYQARRQLHIPFRDRVVVFVGRFVPEKGLETLLEALPAVRESVERLSVCLIGAGPQEDMLRARIKERGLERHVRLIGVRRDIASWYAAADCLVLPSVSEAFPMTVLEAMAVGIPVVATDVGDVPMILGCRPDYARPEEEEVVELEAGFLVRPSDPKGLALALEQALAESPVAERMARRGHDLVLARYTSTYMVEAYTRLYEAELNKKKKGDSPH